MRHLLVALALTVMLGAGADAQTPGAATGPKTARAIAPSGQTKPPSGASALKPETQAAMLKAQQASQARDKAWDSKMRSALGSICRGC